MPLDVGARVLWAVAALHAVVAAGWLIALFTNGPTITGVPYALKPLKFAISIAVFLATLAILLPLLRLSQPISLAIASVLAGTMLIEMICIGLQAARGTTSHFNSATPFDAALWQLMVGAIVIATVTMVLVAFIASFRSLGPAGGEPLSPIMAAAWRIGLWLFLLAAVTGFGMGGRLQHSVQGIDGGEGLAFVNWSVRHGDLRVAHFFALHALQALPIAAFAVERVSTEPLTRAVLFGLAATAMLAVCGFTYVQALRGRPVISATEAAVQVAERDPRKPANTAPARNE
ncbi:MAG: hypothetical protein AAGF12_21595 [Myxococcota bacterium]